jgi:hypothetical protein
MKRNVLVCVLGLYVLVSGCATSDQAKRAKADCCKEAAMIRLVCNWFESEGLQLPPTFTFKEKNETQWVVDAHDPPHWHHSMFLIDIQKMEILNVVGE